MIDVNKIRIFVYFNNKSIYIIIDLIKVQIMVTPRESLLLTSTHFDFKLVAVPTSQRCAHSLHN